MHLHTISLSKRHESKFTKSHGGGGGEGHLGDAYQSSSRPDFENYENHF